MASNKARRTPILLHVLPLVLLLLFVLVLVLILGSVPLRAARALLS